jgi:hypothetical protein
MKKERRDFLKLTTTAATGLALVRANRAYAAWPASGTMDINPAIPNMRVVGLVDTAMMKSVPSSMTLEAQNAAVDWPRVQANMDAMAMALAQKSTADEAWKTIFRSSKDWAATVVAVKVNASESKNTARLAVLQKFSSIFTGWGVKPENFIVYDYHTGSGGTGSGGQAAATTILGPSFSTTDKSKILGVVSGLPGQPDDLLGGWKDGKLGNGSTRRCVAKLVDASVDILIDIANNKGHGYFGKATLCMKNHYGTWEPDQEHTDLNNLIFNMNKGDPIIGGDPPRQQLCFVDSMFCNKADSMGTPELMPWYLVMGTFAPAVDYLTVKKIREEVSKLTHDSATINSYLTVWGYTTSDPQWILVPPASSTPDGGSGGTGGSGAGGTGGTGSGNAGGSTGSGGAGSSGTKGGGGANAGGTTGGGSGGNGGRTDSGLARGGSMGTGGAGSGGNTSSGSASTVSGGGTKGPGGESAGGTSGSGGVASGGTSGSGGAGAGGVSGAGGSPGSSGGSGGFPASSTPGSGGSSASGGSAGKAGASTSQGCACGVAGGQSGRLGVGLVLGALAAGQLRRLFLRKESLAQSAHLKDVASSASAAPADEERAPESMKEKT